MGRNHVVKTNAYTTKVEAYGEKVLRIEMQDGQEHVPSGAMLSVEGTDSEIVEMPEGFLIKAGMLTVAINKADGAICFYDEKENLFAQTYPHETYEKGKEKGFILNFKLDDKEHIYGLGEDNDVAGGRLDRRGTVRDMLTGQRINQNHVTADFPIPFILSAGGRKPYGIYIDNTSNMTIDMGKTVSDKLSVLARAGACAFYVIAGESVPEIIGKYSEMTGRCALPPLWVLGYMQSKCSFWNWEEIDDVILTFKERNVPIDSVVFDFDWAQYFNNYKWADRWEGKSPEKMKYYQENHGIHFMASNSGPMLKKDSDTFESALEAGVLAYDTEGNTVTCGHYSGELMDFTNPKMEEWIAPQLEKVMEEGIEAWWLDLTEPEGDAENTVYYAGCRAEVHNVFSNAVSETYHNVMKKAYPDKRSFVLTRTATAGIQRNPTAVWTGDIYSEYGTLQAHIPEALNTQLSGINMWTCDTGGFLSPTNNEACPHNLFRNDKTEHGELFERWMQFSCFTPIYRAHHAGGEAVPFRYQDITFDGMAHYIKLRYKLLPYIYALYYENYLQGIPMMRPLFWHYPENEKAYTIQDEYLFGENMLVAPVMEAQKTYRKVYFPEGKWYDFDYDYVYEGGKEYEVFAPQNRIPVFVKAGGVIPMSKEIGNTRELDFGRLEARIYPEGTTSFRLYADDGVTCKYAEGDYTCTQIQCVETDDVLTISLDSNNTKYALKEFTAHIYMKKVPEQVVVNGEEIRVCQRMASVRYARENAYYYDAFHHVLHVKMYLSEGCAQLEVKLSAGEAYRPYEPFSEDKIAGQLPYIYPAAAIPCVIQAIHYDRGGEGVAFHRHVADTKGIYRDDNAGIAEGEKGQYIAKLEKGEWLEYSVSSAKEGTYGIVLEGNTANARIQVTLDVGEDVLMNGKGEVTIGTGQKILHIEVLEGAVDIEWIRIIRND